MAPRATPAAAATPTEIPATCPVLRGPGESSSSLSLDPAGTSVAVFVAVTEV